jgi:uncharacterized protein YycO
MIVIGNVIFFKKDNSFISKIIANISKSDYTHVALIIGYDELTGVATIIESNRFVTTRITTTVINEDHVVYSTAMTEEMRKRVVEYAFKQLGTKYDYLQILGLFISLIFKGDRFAFFNSSNKFICSELIDLAFYKAGVKRKNDFNIGNITPQELLVVYELKELK